MHICKYVLFICNTKAIFTSDVSIGMCSMLTIQKVLDGIFVMYKISSLLIHKYIFR